MSSHRTTWREWRRSTQREALVHKGETHSHVHITSNITVQSVPTSHVLSNVLLSFRYKYDWKLEEAQKNILRTHTTAVSARMLYKLAQQVSRTYTYLFYLFNPIPHFWREIFKYVQKKLLSGIYEFRSRNRSLHFCVLTPFSMRTAAFVSWVHLKTYTLSIPLAVWTPRRCDLEHRLWVRPYAWPH